MDIKNIKMLISDVDGVWTDGSFYKGTDNIELKKFSVFDGVGVAMARAAKIRVALISGRFSSAYPVLSFLSTTCFNLSK